jgi:transcriptional regulator
VLIHPWDAMSRTEALAFLTGQGFGHLVASGRERDAAVVVPTQYVIADDAVWLHLARANPIWTAIEENPTVVLSVAGDWAYVPGRWTAVGDEDPARGIPTTYYAAVQVTGPVEVVDVGEVLREQLAVLDPELPDPALHHSRRFAQIQGLRLPLVQLTGKAKYGGNVDDAHRARVRKGLVAAGLTAVAARISSGPARS